ncbi:MAG TPA: hypothetical protein VEA80_09310 [Vitreimonas sp.]|uniref:sodium:calcium antiporter n=1 Tax=Vitreimonas sp. TaxID=3069702 RepID=UPI002D641880|nr:hypothetical protein [Vitreimonas sp.]HYD87660.1 hypothetical protein [Vitreimonas sp.]
MAFWIVVFAGCALVIAFAGWRLTLAVDTIADRTGVGRAFLGMILVATVTSLPELSTGLSAVLVVRSADIAVGDVVGSCVFNLLLFVLADVASGKRAFYGALSASHFLTAAASIVLVGVVALAILTPISSFAVAHVGAVSFALVLLYLGAARLLYAVETRATPALDAPDRSGRAPLGAAIVQCIVAGLAVTAGGALIAVSAGEISERLELAQSFVGVVFVGAATSLPEAVSVIAAIRLKAYDLAAGNLLGSNMFNVLILVADDIAYLDGPILEAAVPSLALAPIVAMVMTGVVIVAIGYGQRTRLAPVDAAAGLALTLLFAFNTYLAATGVGP